jgi:hypothetical protein
MFPGAEDFLPPPKAPPRLPTSSVVDVAGVQDFGFVL